MTEIILNFAVVFMALCASALVTWLLFLGDSEARKREEKRRAKRCDELDDLHGGSWYYDDKRGDFADAMTDRRVADKDQ
jgi:hypothetical protein